MKYRYILIIIVVLLPCLASLVSAQEETISPKWQIGDHWTVKTIYPSPTQENVWSSPTFWSYRVSALDEGRVVLSVLNSDGLEQVKLTYLRNGGALVHAEVAKQRRGEMTVIGLDFQGGAPIVTSQSPAPFDTPVFPLRRGGSCEFLEERSFANNLKVIDKVRQTVSECVASPPEVSVPLPVGSIEVSITRSDGSLLFRQFWSPEHSWPLYGENPNMKYWLVLP